MKYFLLFLLSINCVFAQTTAAGEFARGVKAGINDRESNRTQSDTLTFAKKDAKFNFNRGWRLNLQDNPAYESVAFNDKSWEKLNLSKTYNDLTEITRDTVGWLRKSIFVDTSAVGVPLLVSFDAVGAFEFFIDEKLTHRFGKVSGDKGQPLVTKDSRRILFTFKESGRHQLAFRFLFSTVAGVNKDANLEPLSFNIDRANEKSLKESKQPLDEAAGIVVGMFLLAGIIHWFFFYYFKTNRRDAFNAYLSVAMLLFAIYVYTKALSFDTYQLNWYVIRRSIRDLMFLIGHSLLLIAVYKYLYQHNRVLLTTVIVFALIVGFATNFLVTDDLTRNLCDLATVLLFIGTYIYLLVKARKEKIKSARTLSKALKYFLLSFVIVFVIFIVAVGFITFNGGNIDGNISMAGSLTMIFTLAGPQLAVSFAISADLAREFVRTNVSLTDKIGEIEQLSAEKQEILSKQNEILEHQVRQRTSALNKSITDLKSTQAQLIQSEKLASLGELTAGIAHEIQNPLNFVNNFSEVSGELVDELVEELEKGDLEEVKFISSDLKANLEKIHHHGKRASGIVKSMLEHSRMSTGEKALTDINALADEYLRLAYHGLRAKDRTFNAKMETHFDEKLSKINVVSQDIGRVLLNIINNAFQAPPPQNAPEGYMKNVSVTTENHGGHAIIKISDNGGGISEVNKEKIFQPFFTTKKTGEGTGLGLSLAYDIITKGHGGTLTVVSKENEGTEFVITLPIDTLKVTGADV